jgi:hypothetical protein
MGARIRGAVETCLGRILAVGIVALSALISTAAPVAASEAAPGATLDELMVLARRLNPELAARTSVIIRSDMRRPRQPRSVSHMLHPGTALVLL